MHRLQEVQQEAVVGQTEAEMVELWVAVLVVVAMAAETEVAQAVEKAVVEKVVAVAVELVVEDKVVVTAAGATVVDEEVAMEGGVTADSARCGLEGRVCARRVCARGCARVGRVGGEEGG